MKLLIGLGNPGKNHANNRHNIGFMAVDEIARSFGFDGWRKRFQAEVAEGMIGPQKCLLMKPQTFMNLSGHAAQEAVQFYKLDLGDVIVLHDEIDLAPGKIKVKVDGGNAGHNGLKSVSAQIGNEYLRVRLGVGRPENKAQVPGYVLKDFAKSDLLWREDLLASVSRHIELLLDERQSDFLSAIAQDMRVEEKADVGVQGKDLQQKAIDKRRRSQPEAENKESGGALGAALKQWLKGKDND